MDIFYIGPIDLNTINSLTPTEIEAFLYEWGLHNDYESRVSFYYEYF